MQKSFRSILFLSAVSALIFIAGFFATTTYASHSWGTYHWARTANPFTLKLGDNLSAAWDPYLAVASADWSTSSVLDTTVVPGSSPKYLRNCKATTGKVEICNSSYGYTGWLGVAQIWVSGTHITQGTVKLNDTYFKTTKYNTPAWKQFVMCQEIGHTFGLNHQDENFGNPNLGTCMDYTNDPSTNQHPNQHDYDQLEAIYSHTDDSATTVSSTPGLGQAMSSGMKEINLDAIRSEWGKIIRSTIDGRPILLEKDAENGSKIFTFVVWAE